MSGQGVVGIHLERASRDELIEHILLQRKLIRRLYTKLADIQAGLDSRSPSATVHEFAEDVPVIAAPVQRDESSTPQPTTSGMLPTTAPAAWSIVGRIEEEIRRVDEAIRNQSSPYLSEDERLALVELQRVRLELIEQLHMFSDGAAGYARMEPQQDQTVGADGNREATTTYYVQERPALLSPRALHGEVPPDVTLLTMNNLTPSAALDMQQLRDSRAAAVVVSSVNARRMATDYHPIVDEIATPSRSSTVADHTPILQQAATPPAALVARLQARLKGTTLDRSPAPAATADDRHLMYQSEPLMAVTTPPLPLHHHAGTALHDTERRPRHRLLRYHERERSM